jgi:hypothetical protein
MRLREHTVFLKLSTGQDLASDGRLVRLLEETAVRLGQPWQQAQDLLVRDGRVATWDNALPQWREEWVGQGVHRRLRVRVQTQSVTGGMESFEANATPHPYSGAYVTHLDLRIARSRFATPEACADWVAWFDELAAALTPIDAHAHETDDHAIQNCTIPSMLRNGWGVDPDMVESDRPGREISRGEARYCATWWTYLGPAVLERLHTTVEAALEAPGGMESRAIGEGVRFLLGPSPLDAATFRERQRELRDSLGFDETARRERWTLGFWQRR